MVTNSRRMWDTGTPRDAGKLKPKIKDTAAS